jgi:thymidylate synthase (FAD)
MTHQLVRHRLMGISQQSQRYVNEDAFDYVIPEAMPAEHVDDYKNDMQIIQKMYEKWKDRGLKREDARFVLPNACCSEIVVSANFREWRHIIKMRTSHKAQWEIRAAAKEILRVLAEHSKAVFGDLADEILSDSN